jgi:hypothetical protein
VRAGKTWVQQAKLTAHDDKTGSRGASFWDDNTIAISADGNTVLAPIAVDSNGKVPKAVAVYVFVRNGTQWTEQQKLTLPVIADSSETFRSVSIAVSDDGNTAVIGNSSGIHLVGSSKNSAAYIFARSNKHWALKTRLNRPNSNNSKIPVSQFAQSVAISGDGNRVLIGSPATQVYLTSAYVYQQIKGVWKMAAVLQPLDKGTPDPDLHVFGRSAALSKSGDTALIGDKGSAYVFQFKPQQAVWVQEAKLGSNILERGRFGFSLDLDDSGNNAVIGSGPNVPIGSAFLYTRHYNPASKQNSWSAQMVINGATTPDGKSNDLGAAVAISGNAKTILVGEFADSSLSCPNDKGEKGVCGVVYVLQKP